MPHQKLPKIRKTKVSDARSQSSMLNISHTWYEVVNYSCWCWKINAAEICLASPSSSGCELRDYDHSSTKLPLYLQKMNLSQFQSLAASQRGCCLIWTMRIQWTVWLVVTFQVSSNALYYNHPLQFNNCLTIIEISSDIQILESSPNSCSQFPLRFNISYKDNLAICTT